MAIIIVISTCLLDGKRNTYNFLNMYVSLNDCRLYLVKSSRGDLSPSVCRKIICGAIFGRSARKENARKTGRQNEEEEKGTGDKRNVTKTLIRSNERKSKMPVSVKGEWKKKRWVERERGKRERERGRERKKKRRKKEKKRRELGRGNARMS